MLKQTLAGLAIAVVASTAMLGQAEAGNKKHFGFHGGHHKIWIGHGYGHHYGHGYRRFSECHWLKRKAIRSGKRYWWKRYRACKNDYYGY